MKEIKAYVHRNRVADVIAALKGTAAWGSGAAGGQHNLTLYTVQGSLLPLDNAERHFSVDLGDEVVNEYKLELHCEDAHVDELVQAISDAGRTGQSSAGWIYVVDVVRAESIR
jgi:nitrogen regulatory protein P-II 1